VETTLLGVLIAVASLTLIAAVVTPLFVYRQIVRQYQAQTAQLISNLDRNLGAATKLLEVRDYYEESAAALEKMLQEAYKEGNRFRQEQIRQLLDRLKTMKVRALDKQVRILESESDRTTKKRRRRRRRPRRNRAKEQNGGASGKPDTSR